MSISPEVKTKLVETAETHCGRCLYVGGSDIFNRLNQPAQHLPLHWAKYVEDMDLVGYRRFYDGSPAPAVRRLARGLKTVLTHPVDIVSEGQIRRISVRRLRLPGGMDALCQDLWITLNLRRHLLPHYDVGIVYAPESALLARYLKRTGRLSRLIYHDIDYYPFVSSRNRRIVAWRERMLVQMADAVISVSRPLVALRKEQGARAVCYLPNGVDFDHFHQAAIRRQEHPPTLFYMGTLDMRWGVDLPIQALPIIRERQPETRLLIAGAGPAESELRALVRELKVEDAVRFLGFIPYTELPAVMAEADVGLATSREEIFRQYASPLKLAEYMAAGMPVICSGGGEAELMINESGAGVNIPFSPEACADAACEMLMNSETLAERALAGLAYAGSRTWERLAQTLVEFLAQLEV
jgi:glycosyltransferase involved in cell wall biosynthesis